MSSKPQIAFLGTLVPDNEVFQNKAFFRSANNVQAGIAEGLSEWADLHVLTSQPLQAFPQGERLFCPKKTIPYNTRFNITTLPALNIIGLRELMRGLYAIFNLILWTVRNRKRPRIIMVYNTYSPPLPLVFLAGILTGSKVVGIIYDLGMPPKSLKLDPLRQFIYRIVEASAKFFIPRLDGRIVITDAIAEDYAPGKDFLRIDGGVGESVISQLFPLNLKTNRGCTTFLCAGSLWAGNGVDLLLDALKHNKNDKIAVHFAGQGPMVEEILKASAADNRITYLGMLALQELIAAYEQSDVLLNLRVIPESEGKYLFPSKLLEYLATGKYVMTTSAVHIAKEYGELCYIISDNSVVSVSQAIDAVSTLPAEELFIKGKVARETILADHTWQANGVRIKNYLSNIK